jgi:hypothetical protein
MIRGPILYDGCCMSLWRPSNGRTYVSNWNHQNLRTAKNKNVQI